MRWLLIDYWTAAGKKSKLVRIGEEENAITAVIHHRNILIQRGHTFLQARELSPEMSQMYLERQRIVNLRSMLKVKPVKRRSLWRLWLAIAVVL